MRDNHATAPEMAVAERGQETADDFVAAIESHAEWDEPDAGLGPRFMVDREWRWPDGQPPLEEL